MEQKDSIEFVRLTEREKYFMAFCWTCRSVYAPLHALLCESCVHYNSLYLSISQCALSRCMINLTVAATWTMLHFETNLIRFFEASDCFCFVWNERALLSPSPYFYRYLIQMMCPSPFEYCIDVALLLCSTFVGASQSRSNCVAGIVKSTTSIQRKRYAKVCVWCTLKLWTIATLLSLSVSNNLPCLSFYYIRLHTLCYWPFGAFNQLAFSCISIAKKK